MCELALTQFSLLFNLLLVTNGADGSRTHDLRFVQKISKSQLQLPKLKIIFVDDIKNKEFATCDLFNNIAVIVQLQK